MTCTSRVQKNVTRISSAWVWLWSTFKGVVSTFSQFKFQLTYKRQETLPNWHIFLCFVASLLSLWENATTDDWENNISKQLRYLHTKLGHHKIHNRGSLLVVLPIHLLKQHLWIPRADSYFHKELYSSWNIILHLHSLALHA